MLFRILLFSFFFTANISAQSDSPIQDLDITILAASLDQRISPAVHAQLQSKVLNIFTQHNIINQQGSTFELQPTLSLIEYGKLEGIIKEETVQLELFFMVKNVFSEQVFLIFSHKLNGSGKTKTAALNRAISNIRPQRKVYADFIENLQKKVANYFSEACPTIISDAQRAIDSNNYPKAIAVLSSMPKRSDCRISNQALLEQAYDQFQIQNCQALIQKADAAVLKKNYNEAITILGQVDITSPCQGEARQLLETIKEKADQQTAKKMDFLNKVYKDNVEIEKVRQQNMKAISNTYIEGIKKD